MLSQKKPLLWLKAQGTRGAVLAMKIFPPYFLYILVRKIFNQRQKDKLGKMLSLFLLYEFPSVPRTHENRRIVISGWREDLKHIVRILRDSFPEDPRLKFGWGNYQANSCNSLNQFPQFHEERAVYIATESPLFGLPLFKTIKNLEDPKMESSIYFRVALHDSSTLNNGHFVLPAQVGSQRLENIFQQTNTILKPYRKTGSHILYPLQMPYETNSPGINSFEAAQYDLINLRRYTSRPIVITVKPAMIRDKILRKWAKEKNPTENQIIYGFLKKLCEKLNIKIYDTYQTTGKDSYSLLIDCWCVVCQSGTFSVDAVAAGVPAITLSPSNFMHPICSHDLSEVENPKMPDRVPWLSRLAYCQWTLAEVKNGEVWRHFQPTIERLLEDRKQVKDDTPAC